MAACEVIVVGAGNAALAAAIAARDAGAGKVLVLEKATRASRGGNTFFSGGLFRFAFETVDELLRIVPEAERLPGFRAGIEAYPKTAFRADLMRLTEGRADPELTDILVDNSHGTMRWLIERGIRMEPAVSLGGVRVGEVIRWPKGAVVRAVDEGVGLSQSWFAIAEDRGVEIRYETAATGLVLDAGGRVTGVAARGPDGDRDLAAKAVVLACGGFEANAAWRAQYLGRPWDHAKVRGTRYNQGDGLRMALDRGALPCGQWSGCHATPIDAAAPAHGEPKLTDKTNRLSYPYGVMINRLGRRFVDEGEDQQFFTYAKYGGIILNQPQSLAYQIFDAKVSHLLEPRYATSEPVKADDIELGVHEGRNSGAWTVGIYATGVHDYERLQMANPDYLIPSAKYLPELIFTQIQSKLMRGELPGEGLAYDPTDADIRLGRRMRTDVISRDCDAP